jgi:hypothetical protein
MKPHRAKGRVRGNCSLLFAQLPVLGLERLSNIQRVCLKESPGALGLSSQLRYVADEFVMCDETTSRQAITRANR